jgi:hypothetical protein
MGLVILLCADSGSGRGGAADLRVSAAPGSFGCRGRVLGLGEGGADSEPACCDGVGVFPGLVDAESCLPGAVGDAGAHV